jgi:hypothetical protein
VWIEIAEIITSISECGFLGLSSLPNPLCQAPDQGKWRTAYRAHNRLIGIRAQTKIADVLFNIARTVSALSCTNISSLQKHKSATNLLIETPLFGGIGLRT